MMGAPKGYASPGAENREPVAVTITKGFWLGKFEVTQFEWQQLMGTTVKDLSRRQGPENHHGFGARYPIYYITYDDASAFCARLSEREHKAKRLPPGWEYRLPTSAQWEYACRAGTTTLTAFGDTQLTKAEANIGGTNQTATVGNYKANAWGFHDMYGNVQEWCRDGYEKIQPGGNDPESPVAAEAGWAKLRTIRGGSKQSTPEQVYSGRLTHAEKDQGGHTNGFRVALVPIDK
jgi:formylglycine-generating enzyme required for sulfatase activity